MLHEAPQELHRGECHGAPLPVVGIVLPAEGDALPVERDQAMIADGDAMGIASKVAEDGGGGSEGRLRIDHPVGTKQRVHAPLPVHGVAAHGGRATEIQVTAGVGTAQPRDELAAKDPTEDFDGEEEARVLRVHPASVIRGEAPGRHDAAPSFRCKAPPVFLDTD